jgi:RNA 2',3'-cyclic 3'-phosphodiesterase
LTRTFIAADLDEAFLDAAAAIPISVGRRVKRETMHCTLTFFGEVDDARLVELKTLVEGLPHGPIAVKATRLDAFASPRKAHVVVLPLEDDGSLARLHEAIGLKEDRPYRPHLTLARLKKPEDLRTLVESTPVSIEGRVVGVTLYESVLGKNGPTYTPLARALG